MANLRLNMSGLLLAAFAGAMSVPGRALAAMREQHKLDDAPEAKHQIHFRSGRSHAEKCMARRNHASLHPKHVNRRAGGTGYRSAPNGMRWQNERLVPRFSK